MLDPPTHTNSSDLSNKRNVAGSRKSQTKETWQVKKITNKSNFVLSEQATSYFLAFKCSSLTMFG